MTRIAVASPCLPAASLHLLQQHEALALVDDILGKPESWPSPLITYRLGSGFQADWKEEVGHALNTARRLGFLGKLVQRVAAAKQPSDVDQRTANDPSHRRLLQELAPAVAVHYFVGTGWGFDSWEPKSPVGSDIDFWLRDPGGARVAFQTKASDQPGDVVGGRHVDGEHDEWIVTALEKAAKQLPKGGNPNIVVMSAIRTVPLCLDPGFVVAHLIGGTVGGNGQYKITHENRGRFFSPDWSHVSAVVLLDLIRADAPRYGCTVLTNPVASHPLNPHDFPRAWVAYLEENIFKWKPGPPGEHHLLPDGTVLTGQLIT